jgi:hypothetical protein
MIYLEKEQKARQGKARPLSVTLFFDSSKKREERRGEGDVCLKYYRLID